MKTKYKLRAECLADITKFLASARFLASYKIKPLNNGIDHTLEIETEASLEKIISCIALVPDSHVMLDTIKPIKQYTGKRD